MYCVLLRDETHTTSVEKMKYHRDISLVPAIL